eukprot:CAMPEP_0182580800 /NCGR_PEP_ID=MMETSP1324-20130603/48132_1 /TAXON_ID=236786 /ORGANISM="Florenciella sp., Strain RCC1587" /LENGTH=126 /DNA_ID=CAMNT_0024797083 /DNA_START=120 /DNA_END=500 /DNA_ORIENTATION=-
MALEYRARLVPALSMGEWELMDNIHLPIIQKPARKLLGFPAPFVPMGRFFLPIPKAPPHGVTVVLGKPIDCIPSTADGSVTREDVELFTKRYFDALASIFERHKARCGYPHMELVMLDKGERIPDE